MCFPLVPKCSLSVASVILTFFPCWNSRRRKILWHLKANWMHDVLKRHYRSCTQFHFSRIAFLWVPRSTNQQQRKRLNEHVSMVSIRIFLSINHFVLSLSFSRSLAHSNKRRAQLWFDLIAVFLQITTELIAINKKPFHHMREYTCIVFLLMFYIEKRWKRARDAFTLQICSECQHIRKKLTSFFLSYFFFTYSLSALNLPFWNDI